MNYASRRIVEPRARGWKTAGRATECLAATFTSRHHGYTRPCPRLDRQQATRQWDGTGAPGNEDSDVESLAHNIQIGAPRYQIRRGSPKRQRRLPGDVPVYAEPDQDVCSVDM
jgi:hypothetical protein